MTVLLKNSQPWLVTRLLLHSSTLVLHSTPFHVRLEIPLTVKERGRRFKFMIITVKVGFSLNAEDAVLKSCRESKPVVTCLKDIEDKPLLRTFPPKVIAHSYLRVKQERVIVRDIRIAVQPLYCDIWLIL